jgi:hypothetical protein
MSVPQTIVFRDDDQMRVVLEPPRWKPTSAAMGRKGAVIV